MARIRVWNDSNKAWEYVTQNAFSTIKTNDVLFDAESPSDTFTIVNGDHIDIKTTGTFDSVSINVNDIGNLLNLSTTNKTDLVSAINEVFQSGANVKNNVVTALNTKGVSVTTNSSWNDIATAIGNIKSGNTADTEITKLNVTGSSSVPYVKSIKLNNPIIDYKMLTDVREFVTGTEYTNLVCDFNNADSTSFVSTNGTVVFDGTMHLASVNTTNNMTNLGSLGSGNQWKYTINKSNFNTIESITAVNGITPQINMVGTNLPYIVKALSDINLTGVVSLDGIIFNTTTTNGGKMLLAMSVDGGNTYYAYNGTSWVLVDVTNLSDFASKGMSKSVTDTLTNTQLEVLRNGSAQLRFAYYLSVVNTSSTASTDSISIKVLMNGGLQPATKTDYDVVMESDKQTIDFKFYKNGTFTINYVNN